MAQLQGQKILSWICAGILLATIGCSNDPTAIFYSNWDSRESRDHPSTSGVAYGAPLENSYEAAALAILQNDCVSCHGSTTGPQGIYNLLDVNYLVLSRLVIPGQPGQSPLFTSVSNGSMPPSAPLDAADQATLSAWITGSTSP